MIPICLAAVSVWNKPMLGNVIPGTWIQGKEGHKYIFLSLQETEGTGGKCWQGGVP